MSRRSSPYLPIFLQDLRVTIKAFEAENYESANIFSNRIMSNSVISNERSLAFVGFFLKDLNSILEIIRRRSETAAFSTAKTIGLMYARDVEKRARSNDLDSIYLWESHLGFMNRIREFLMDEFESGVYGEPSIEFIQDSYSWLLHFLENNKDLLYDRNNLIEGILNEMGRLWKTHGIGIENLYPYMLLIALKWCNDYIRVTSREPAQLESKIKESIFPYIDRLISMVRKENPVQKEIEDLLWELISEWRKNFIKFMEIAPRPIPAGHEPEDTIEIPEETKEKLTEAITDSLEKGIKKK